MIQISPGDTFEATLSVTTGLTIERSQTLASSLGLDIKGGVMGIQAQLSSELRQEFGLKVNITAQEQRTKKLTLSNKSRDRYRRIALWHVDHQISVAAFDLSITPVPGDFEPFHYGTNLGSYGAPHPRWIPRGEVEFAVANDPFITDVEIKHP